MLTTSLDGQWAIVRRDREVTLLAKAMAPAQGRITLEEDDVDLAFVGPPTVLITVVRDQKGEGHAVSYWRQAEGGRWEKQA